MFIHFNSKFRRFEVYSTSGVVRAGEIQPVYVSADREKAVEYVRRAAK